MLKQQINPHNTRLKSKSKGDRKYIFLFSKITKITNCKKIQNVKLQNQKLKHIKRWDNNCHISVLVQKFSYGLLWIKTGCLVS